MKRLKVQITQLHFSDAVLLISELKLVFVVLAADNVSGLDELGQLICLHL